MKTKLLLFSLGLALTLPGATVNYSATGTTTPHTNGNDPHGNQYQISNFGGNGTFSLPGYPHLFSGGGLVPWLGPDCILTMTVSAWGLTPGAADTALAIDPFSTFYNATLAVIYNETITGNSITFSAPNVTDVLRTGQFGNIAVHATNGASFSAVRFDVEYTAIDHAPEPASMALTGIGLLAAGLIQRRRMRKS